MLQNLNQQPGKIPVTPTRIELGAGQRKLPGWLTLDIAPMADIRCDIAGERLPFADESVDEIYSSHFLEHFYHAQLVEHVLPECLRILKPGAMFNVAVPDASIYISAYNKGEQCPEVIPIYKKAYFFHTPIDSINYIAYMAGDHKHMFDRDNLKALLEYCGFANVRPREYDAGIDVPKRQPQSIYCVAYKPTRQQGKGFI